MIEPAVRLLLLRVPELKSRYVALAQAADGDPGTGVTLGELGEVVSELAARLAEAEPLLTRTLAAVEEVAALSSEDRDTVAAAFLESLSPDDVRVLGPWFGPATRAALDDLELPRWGQHGDEDDGRAGGRGHD
jgi:hypothetical protein